MRCLLDIGSLTVPIDIPSQCLRGSELESLREIYLRIPGEVPQPVSETRALTPLQQREANTWIAEMESFDRF